MGNNAKKQMIATRTYRKFDSSQHISLETLTPLLELARFAGSARNCQPWQFMPITDAESCSKIFPHLAWAGYLPDWNGPEKHQRPTAYILCYLNKNWLKGSIKEAYFDLGISSQNILLGATEIGLGGCRIAAFSKKLNDIYPHHDHLELHLVIALGTPTENVVIDKCRAEDIKYWRDENLVHHVPKRSLSDILLFPPK